MKITRTGQLYLKVSEAARQKTGVELDAEEVLSLAIVLLGGDPDCLECRSTGVGMGPRHEGTKNCESGSLASGGTVAHCSCDVCF